MNKDPYFAMTELTNAISIRLKNLCSSDYSRATLCSRVTQNYAAGQCEALESSESAYLTNK